ncbi:MAG: hypothetical protein A7316_00685 [Candidatus Altiarchaeales archaeon WOR_SM1_86-2]|nr:MAG: hypothetical protein A7315_05395 [Candidatus Altiarchaeales archaeon WOR_SM1_79]ODS39024.1 MAG: hypothetical protein A7316_00685 [Candidatus Altiarchaeales archaeon WOR_SM1_86-2]
MSEILVRIPDELEHEIEMLPGVNWQRVALNAIQSKAFELTLKRSRKLRLLLLKTITSKSKLSEEEADKFALELGDKIKEERLEELKIKNLV